MHGSSITCPVVHLCSSGRIGPSMRDGLPSKRQLYSLNGQRLSVRRPGPSRLDDWCKDESGKARSLNMEIPFFIFLFSSILELLAFSGQSLSLFQSFHLFILYSISEWREKPITSNKVGFFKFNFQCFD